MKLMSSSVTWHRGSLLSQLGVRHYNRAVVAILLLSIITLLLMLQLVVPSAALTAHAQVVCVVSTERDVNIRAGAGTEYDRVGVLPRGSQSTAIMQAEDDEGMTWWQLESGGWVRNDTVSEPDICNLLPFPDGSLPSVPTPQSCVGRLPSRMLIGQPGRVIPDGEANNLRDRPTTASGRVGQIPPGGEFTVLEGPACADGYAWWLVDYRGIIGWTAEADNVDYWIEPLVQLATEPTQQPTVQPTDQPPAQPTDQPATQPTEQPTQPAASEPTPLGPVRVFDDEPVFSVGNEADILFRETFSDNAADWQMRIFPVSTMIENGMLRFQSPLSDEEMYTFTKPGNTDASLAPTLDEPFEMLIAVSDGTCSRPHECQFSMFFDLQGDYARYLQLMYGAGIGGDYGAYAFFNGDDERLVYNTFPVSYPDPFDGAPHVFRLQVTEDRIRFFVDEVRIFSINQIEPQFNGTFAIGVTESSSFRLQYGISVDEVLIMRSREAEIRAEQLALPVNLNRVTAYEHHFGDGSGNMAVVRTESASGSTDVRGGFYQVSLTDTVPDSNDYVQGEGFLDVSFDDYSEAPYLDAPYLYEIAALPMEPFVDGRACVRLLFDVQPALNSYEVFSYCNDAGSSHWINQGRVLFGEYEQNDGEVNNLALAPQQGRFDRAHTFGVRRTTSGAEFLIDGRTLWSVGMNNHLGGTVGFGIQEADFQDGETVTLRVSDITIAPLEAPQLTSSESYTEAELVTMREDGNTILIETFDERPSWATGAAVRGGVMSFDISATGQGSASTFNLGIVVDEPFEIEYELQIEPVEGNGRFFFNTIFNRREFQLPGILTSSTETASLQFLLRGQEWGYDLVTSAMASTIDYYPLSSGVNIEDGQLHRYLWRITQLGGTGGNITVTLLIDGEQAAEYVVAQTVINDAFLPFVTEINGEVRLRVGVEGTAHVRGILDNLIIRRYQPGALAAGTGLGEADQVYSSEISRLQLRYPEGWVETPRPSALDPEAGYLESHIITMTNTSQGVTGAANEIGFSIYDPVAVTIYTRIADVAAAPLETTLEALVDALNEVDVWSALIVETTEINGREVVLAQGRFEQVDVTYAIFRSSDGRATAMAFVMSSGQYETFLPTIQNIIASADYPAPSQSYDVAETAIRNFLTYAYLGQFDDAVNSMCLPDLIVIQAAGLLLEDTDAGFDPLFNVDDLNFTVDLSGLYLESLDPLSDGRAQVRIGGVVTRLFSDGEIQVIPHQLYFTPIYQPFFGLDVMAAMNDGNWSRCTGAFGF